MFSKKIINWYQHNKRDLPWRATKDPYKVWLSEIILQQTRVAQGLPYYNKFLNSFPKLKNLAMASEQEVLKLWQGLGYYSRARNLHTTAKYIQNDLDGNFPVDYDSLLELKGIGDYTAAAIASFCKGEKRVVVDGNVYRVLARYFGIDTAINSHAAKKEFKALAFELMDKKNPGLFNQAIMEFGALQCTPAQPDCNICPLKDSCVGLQKDKVAILPVKEKKHKIVKRYFNYLILVTDKNKTFVKMRKGKGIWQHLYEFPLVESDKSIDYKTLIEDEKFIEYTEQQDFSLKLLTDEDIVHKLTHQHLFIKFWSVALPEYSKKAISWESASHLPFPIVIHNFIESFRKQNGIKLLKKQ